VAFAGNCVFGVLSLGVQGDDGSRRNKVSFLRVQPGDIKARLAIRMLGRPKIALIVLAGVVCLTGCAQITTRSLPKAEIGSRKHIFVERRLADNYGVSEEIARQLRAMGYDASAGALTMMPIGTELVVSYDDMWTWDFTTYMIEIDIQVRSARTDKIVAVGHYFGPHVVLGHAPPEMIHELLLKLFKHA